MGVGDGRYFLRQTLERDWVQYADEITAERNFGCFTAYFIYQSVRAKG